jgi:hypothetical protein
LPNTGCPDSKSLRLWKLKFVCCKVCCDFVVTFRIIFLKKLIKLN